MKTNLEHMVEINDEVIDADHIIDKTIKSDPKKAFDVLFEPKQDFHNWCEVKKGERAFDGLWIECIFPVYSNGNTHHITETIIKNGKVTWAFSNMCGGITFAPGRTRASTSPNHSDRWYPWGEISHFEDPAGNRYEKVKS